MKAGSVVDAEIHGKGEGIFMKGLNCGCAVAIGLVILSVILVVIGSMQS